MAEILQDILINHEKKNADFSCSIFKMCVVAPIPIGRKELENGTKLIRVNILRSILVMRKNNFFVERKLPIDCRNIRFFANVLYNFVFNVEEF